MKSEDTKGVIRSHKSTNDRTYNGQKRKNNKIPNLGLYSNTPLRPEINNVMLSI
jgi:hypothetical protein